MIDRPLTVVQLVPSLESGGVERGTLEVSRALVRRGHRSIVISAGGRLVDPLVKGGAEHITWPIGRKSPATIACVLQLRRWLMQQRVDVLHARSRIPAWVGWLAWRTLPPTVRPRFVTTMHGLNSVNWFSRIMTRGEVVVAVSESVREHILANYPHVPASRIHVIHRGVEPDAFPFGFRPAADWRQRWFNEHPQLTGRQVLTLAGRITRLKGHHDFLSLLARLKGEGRAIHGLIAGDEDPRRRQYAAEIRRRVRELRLSADVTFLGHRSDIREIYAASDVVVSLSSTPESFGRTTLEPLSLGVPVVGYDHGGVGEILEKVFPRGRVPVSDHQELHRRVASLLDAPPAMHPVSGFRLADMLDGTLQLYTQLAARLPDRNCSRAA